MAETSRFWTGTTVGDAIGAPYDAPTEFSNVLKSLAGAAGSARDRSGVFMGELNNLAPSGTVSPINITSGRALVYGAWYQLDAATTLAIPTPGGATRLDYVVLRKDWTTQEVRLTRVAGVEGGGLPVLAQTEGLQWDAVIASVSITTGGVITTTDRRSFIGCEQISPLAIVYRSGSNQAIGDAAYASVTYDNVEFEGAEFNIWDAGNPTRLTAPLPGIYRVRHKVLWAASATNARMVRIFQNNLTVLEEKMVPVTGGAGQNYTQDVEWTGALNAGDYVECQCYQNSGAPLNIIATQSTVRASMQWVRPRW